MTGPRVRHVVITEHEDGTATVAGTSFGDGSWTWLHRHWTWSREERLWRHPAFWPRDDAFRRELVLSLARQLRMINITVTTVLLPLPNDDTVDR